MTFQSDDMIFSFSRRPNPVPLGGSKRGRPRPTSGIDNPALDAYDGDLDDPTAGGVFATNMSNHYLGRKGLVSVSWIGGAVTLLSCTVAWLALLLLGYNLGPRFSELWLRSVSFKT